MAEVLKKDSDFKKLPSGQYFAKFAYNKKPLSIRVEHNEVVHIGYLLFSEQQRKALHSPTYDFIERYLLAVRLPLKREKTVEKQLAEDDVNFEKGEMAVLEQMVGSEAVYKLSIDKLNNKRYKVSWSTSEDSLLCSIDFPISYDLLHGTEMIENEQRLAEFILKSPKVKPNPQKVDEQSLKKDFLPGYFILPGQSLYTEQLNTNRYYEKDNKGTLQLIYSKRYPLETLANLLTTNELGNDIVAKVCLKKYDFNEECFSVPLIQFVNYFLEQGCIGYFGVMEYEQTTAVCQLVMSNEDEGYCHAMKVTYNVEHLTEPESVMEIRLTSYVPTSKIKFLL